MIIQKLGNIHQDLFARSSEGAEALGDRVLTPQGGRVGSWNA